MDLQNDQDWLDALASSGDQRERALTQLRELLVRGLRRGFAGRSGRSDSSVEDAAQEAVLKIIANLHSFQGASRFTTWAMSIAVRTAIGQARRAHWRDVSLDEMVEAGRIRPAAKELQRTGEDKIAFERLVGVILKGVQNALTEKQRQTIEAELAGAPTDEIATRMGVNRNAVYKLGFDARARLKKIILESGWTEQQVRQLMSRD